MPFNHRSLFLEKTLEIVVDISFDVTNKKAQKFWFTDSGATAIEYAIIACSVSLVIVGAVDLIGLRLSSVFMEVSKGFK